MSKWWLYWAIMLLGWIANYHEEGGFSLNFQWIGLIILTGLCFNAWIKDLRRPASERDENE
jgi:hypothetical protein